MSGFPASGRSAKRYARANPQSRADRTAHYQHYAAQFRSLANDEPSDPQREKLAKLARRYAQLVARNRTTP
jgi:hypothetical protein